MQITIKNAAVGLPLLVNDALDFAYEQPSRNGPTLEFPGITSIEYTNPLERQIFCPIRDENPFFNYLEGLWMLAGRRDVEFLKKIVGNMATFSDDGEVFNAAYGYRMRTHFGFDQLKEVVRQLSANHDTRQAVVQLWCPMDLDKVTKDKACNTQIVFKIRKGKLNMTVFNRSNDLIWGALGANKSHFSMIMEYVAAAVGVEVGSYYQVSNCMHVYTDLPVWAKLVEAYEHDVFMGAMRVEDPYAKPENSPFPLVGEPEMFLREIEWFCEYPTTTSKIWMTPAIEAVAQPLYFAYLQHKSGDTYGAINLLQRYMVQCDFKTAAIEWLQRRLKGQEEKRYGHGQDITSPDTVTK
jgi:hypothetical protein